MERDYAVRTSGWSASGDICLYCEKKGPTISTPFNSNTGLFPALVIQNMVISENHLQLAQHQGVSLGRELLDTASSASLCASSELQTPHKGMD